MAEGAYFPLISATGGMAERIGIDLRSSEIVADGPHNIRPTNDELNALSNSSLAASKLIELALKVLRCVQIQLSRR